MIAFEKIDGPFGIPVYFQELPDIIRPCSLRWLVFTGAADDEAIGQEGIYHWFEHVPFRGTVRFPGGYAATQARFTQRGGSVGAHTGQTRAAFYAYVPHEAWQEALDLLTDLVGQPLLDRAGVEGERQIIREELTSSLSSAGRRAGYDLPRIIWPNHPLGHPVIGTEATLYGMQPDLLTAAHAAGYSRSRCVLVACGAISRSALLDEVARVAERIPDRPLTERRMAASHGPAPVWQGGVVTERELSFPTSTVLLLFSLPPWSDNQRSRMGWSVLKKLFHRSGDMSCPLSRILREERNLVYGTGAGISSYPDGGYLAFMAEARAEFVPAIQQSFWDVLNDPYARSPERLQHVYEAMRGQLAMHLVKPDNYTNKVEEQLDSFGEVISQEEWLQLMTSYSHEELMGLLEMLTPDRAHAIIFRGTAKV